MSDSWRQFLDDRAKYSMLNAAGAVLAAIAVAVDWGEGTGELLMYSLLCIAVVVILFASYNLLTLDDGDGSGTRP